MNLHFTDLQVLRRVRSSDPHTSHRAAERTTRFANAHADRIAEAVRFLQSKSLPATQNTIAMQSGLTVAQVSKRLGELERSGRLYVMQDSAGDIEFEGCRCWGVL